MGTTVRVASSRLEGHTFQENLTPTESIREPLSAIGWMYIPSLSSISSKFILRDVYGLRRML